MHSYLGKRISNTHARGCQNVLAFFVKQEKKLYRSTLINLYYSFAYPYFIYCNHVWGQNYPSCLERISLIQKKIVRIITCSPFRAHTEPLYFANTILNVSDINDYIIGIFMYECLYGNIPDIFRNNFQRNADVHDPNVRNANDLHVPYGRLDIRKFSIKIAGANLWNSLSSLVKNSHSIHIFKNNYEALLNWGKRIYLKVWLTLCPPLRHACVSERDQHPLWQWLVAYSVPIYCLNKCWLFCQLDHHTLDKEIKIFIAENGFRNVICKMLAIFPKW